jgi:hypothetical protein
MHRFLRTLRRTWKAVRSRGRAQRLVRAQLVSEDWPEVRAVVARLRAAGLSEREAERRLVAALEREIGRMMAVPRPFDRAAYVADLAARG